MEILQNLCVFKLDMEKLCIVVTTFCHHMCDENGEYPLFAARREGNKDTVELLLQEKADVNQCNSKGVSLLYAVCSFHYKLHSYFSKNSMKQFSMRYIETVKLLLAWKADVTLLNTNGQTPLDIARASQCVELIRLFEENLQ
ncbi:Hypothetical predicted protein [Mytilus galloprovincialis]|uniref:Uncharacterized protein n=1 Tax=Mytilus galloprovincialis TaxID=29158 RepID=A0A8B6DF55_MYTGA|nr:Hypothetical predicted protein [Mytilus galloprovincialis]